jgi:hypothetical protein
MILKKSIDELNLNRSLSGEEDQERRLRTERETASDDETTT